MTAPRRHRLLALLLVGALLAGACSGDGDAEGGAGDTGATLRDVGAQVIVPGYEQLATDLSALGASYDELCADPGAEALEASRGAWRTASLSWQRTRAGLVGPGMERRLTADVAFEARPDPVEDLVASDEPIDTETLRDAGSTFRGLAMMEALLFDDTSSDLGSGAGARRCELLAAVTPISLVAVQTVVDDWTEGPDGEEPYIETFAAGEEGDPLMSVDDLTNQVTACLTAIDDNGIRDLALAETLDDALSTRRDGPARTTMAEHRALLDSVATVVDGGLAVLVEARSPETADRLRQLTDEAVAALDVLPDSVDDAYTDDLDGLRAAADAVAALKVLVTTEVASQLGVTIRFSDADGDA